jgi:hypothetical protein
MSSESRLFSLFDVVRLANFFMIFPEDEDMQKLVAFLAGRSVRPEDFQLFALTLQEIVLARPGLDWLRLPTLVPAPSASSRESVPQLVAEIVFNDPEVMAAYCESVRSTHGTEVELIPLTTEERSQLNMALGRSYR